MSFKKITLLLCVILVFELFDKSEEEKPEKHSENISFSEDYYLKSENTFKDSTGSSNYKILGKNGNIINNVDKPVIIKDVSNIDFYDGEITV